jgi:hypothetical protein
MTTLADLERVESHLASARRLLHHIEKGVLVPTPAVIDEIARSIEHCTDVIRQMRADDGEW